MDEGVIEEGPPPLPRAEDAVDAGTDITEEGPIPPRDEGAIEEGPRDRGGTAEDDATDIFADGTVGRPSLDDEVTEGVFSSAYLSLSLSLVGGPEGGPYPLLSLSLSG